MSVRNRFESLVTEKIEAQSYMLVDGKCDDIEMYRRACGIIYGLKMALECMAEASVVKNDEEPEEEIEGWLNVSEEERHNI